LTRRLHRGGTFDLFRAAANSDLGPGCYVVKTPRKKSSPTMAAARLCREASVMMAVRHPNLNCVLAADTQTAEPYLLLPFHDGVSLRELLRSPAAGLPLSRVLQIMRQLAAALAALHSAGWLHSQVRPEHIFLSPQGQTTLLDLTLARRLDTPECDVAAGLPIDAIYAAPEFGCRSSRVASAADTYSVGIVLYEVLAGRPPFVGSSREEVLNQHRRDAASDVRALRPDVSLELAHLLRLMLAKEPLRRPTDGELLRWLAELEIAALAI
jgi:serine/threonine protein kinase